MDVIKANKDMVEVYHRFKTHLSANKIDLNTVPFTLGPVLTMDSETERFTGDFSPEANMLLTRNYRKPFVVPEHV